jgi:hypothetical protein
MISLGRVDIRGHEPWLAGNLLAGRRRWRGAGSAWQVGCELLGHSRGFGAPDKADPAALRQPRKIAIAECSVEADDACEGEVVSPNEELSVTAATEHERRLR